MNCLRTSGTKQIAAQILVTPVAGDNTMIPEPNLCANVSAVWQAPPVLIP